MTDLDLKIAELKGWRPITQSDLERFDKSKVRQPSFHAVLCRDRPDGGIDVANDWMASVPWSQDIAKAFELVDEVCIDQDNKKGARFHLIQWEAKTGIAAHWEARIEPYWIDGEYTLTQVGNRFDGRGQTRPEAICRAYIALREREGKK